MSVFSPQVVFTLPNGDVVVGHNAVRDKFAIKLHTEQRAATVHQRLLQTPESLPARTMCIDQVVSCASSDFGDETSSQRMLIVLKRRATDGLVTNFTEEEGHRRVRTLRSLHCRYGTDISLLGRLPPLWLHGQRQATASIHPPITCYRPAHPS